MLPAPADSSQEHPGSTLTFIERRRLGFERLAGLAAYFINVWHFQRTLEVAKCCAVVHELYCSVAVPRSAGCHRVTGPLPAPNETRGPPPASSSRWLFPLLSASSKDTCFIPMGRVSLFPLVSLPRLPLCRSAASTSSSSHLVHLFLTLHSQRFSLTYFPEKSIDLFPFLICNPSGY